MIIVGILAYPVYLFGIELGALYANNPTMGIVAILTLVILAIPSYFFGIKLGKYCTSKLIKNRGASKL